MKKLEELKKVIRKCNSEIDIYVRHIQLADVLIAMPIMNVNDYEEIVKRLTCQNGWYEESWNLKENLDNQNKPTIEFLYNLLVKN